MKFNIFKTCLWCLGIIVSFNQTLEAHTNNDHNIFIVALEDANFNYLCFKPTNAKIMVQGHESQYLCTQLNKTPKIIPINYGVKKSDDKKPVVFEIQACHAKFSNVDTNGSEISCKTKRSRLKDVKNDNSEVLFNPEGENIVYVLDEDNAFVEPAGDKLVSGAIVDCLGNPIEDWEGYAKEGIG